MKTIRTKRGLSFRGLFTRIAAWSCLASIATFSACSSHAHEPLKKHVDPVSEKPSPSNDPSGTSLHGLGTEPGAFTKITAHHVIFHESSGIRLRAIWVEGRLYPTRPGVIPSLDDPTSFKVEVDSGFTAISLNDLSHCLVTGILKGSNLTGVKIAAPGPQEIEITGTLHRVLPLPVKLRGEIEATPDGRLRINIRSIKILKIPAQGILRAVRLQASDVLKVGGSQAVQVNGNSIFLETGALLPPPRKSGRITSVHFTPDGELEEDYGTRDLQRALQQRGKVQNFLALKGGSVQLGKLIMRDADLTLIDSSPGDWFECDLARYHAQLEAGDIHMTEAGGLLIFTPDITKIRSLREQSEPRISR